MTFCGNIYYKIKKRMQLGRAITIRFITPSDHFPFSAAAVKFHIYSITLHFRNSSMVLCYNIIHLLYNFPLVHVRVSQ